MGKKELIHQLMSFYEDSKKLAKKEKRCLEDKDEKALKKIVEILSD